MRTAPRATSTTATTRTPPSRTTRSTPRGRTTRTAPVKTPTGGSTSSTSTRRGSSSAEPRRRRAQLYDSRMRWLVCSVAVVAVLLAPSAGGTTLAAPALAVDGNADRHAISPEIYGLNFADASLAAELALPVDRWGGNSTDAYNWRLHSSNTGNDWFFENLPDCWNDADGWCSDGPVNGAVEFVDKDRRAGAKTLLTLPMMGYVAKDARLDHPFTCGFPASVFPDQDAFDPYDPNCGNGVEN